MKLAAAAGVAALAITWMAWQLASGDGLREAPVSGALRAPSLLGAGSDVAATPVPPHSRMLRPIAQVEEALFVKGSLRGTEYPAWGTLRGEPVTPNRALRDRFDYYLLALNEASLAELSALVRAHAERDLGAAAAAAITALWERYLRLQQHAFTHVARPSDPGSMQTALQEHQQVRQSILGVHWAQAFYGDEEKALAADLARALSGQPTRAHNPELALFQPATGADPQVLHQQRSERFGVDAAQRLRALDEEDAQWVQRLARTRAEVAAIRGNPAYSPTQREEAIARHLDSTYPDATERLRASGLLEM